jgi:large subunit ribosomal protein L28
MRLVPQASAGLGLLVALLAVMAAVCDICGKTPGFGNKISHSHRRSRRRFDPNIHKMRVMVDGAPKRLAVCTKCLKANKVARVG